MTHAVGIDIGGTFIKAALVSEEGKVIRRTKIETGVEGGIEEIECRIFSVFNQLKTDDLAGVGIGVPGMVSVAQGVVVQSPNIPPWRGYGARREFSKKLGVNVVVDNDANMAALAEGWVGVGKGVGNFMMITLGTGIGAGIILNGRLWHGDTGRAGEFGHIVIEPGGAPCGCGNRGCVERYASADGMRRIAGEMGLKADIPQIMQLAGKGDETALKVFEIAGRSLGLALSCWFNLTDVRSVIVSGGASPSLRFLLSHVNTVLEKAVYGVKTDELNIVRSSLGEEAGMIGSARSALLSAAL